MHSFPTPTSGTFGLQTMLGKCRCKNSKSGHACNVGTKNIKAKHYKKYSLFSCFSNFALRIPMLCTSKLVYVGQQIRIPSHNCTHSCCLSKSPAAQPSQKQITTSKERIFGKNQVKCITTGSGQTWIWITWAAMWKMLFHQPDFFIDLISLKLSDFFDNHCAVPSGT